MDRTTRLALNALNQRFYAEVAAEFSATRRAPWPGFARVLARAHAHTEALTANPSAPYRVLDLGAGDGRFGAFALEHGPASLEYLGVDASDALLAIARARELGPRARFERADFVAEPAAQVVPPGPYELVALFGVLHHVPSFAARAELIGALARRVAAFGCLALTFWRLERDPRFARRVIPWSAYNAVARPPIRESELEPGDVLLGWGARDAPARYCHFPDASESERLIAASGLVELERFAADGRSGALNDYVLLTRPRP